MGGDAKPDKKKIGKYDILGVLGKGAMGLVYRAEDPLLGRQVALKVITGTEISDEMKTRFIHEARAVARLDHPNIVVVYDLGEEEGSPYIAMELLHGEDLKSILRRRSTLPVREAADIVTQVCDGLGYAHERKIVHRDIKPANIHVCPDGRVKIMDFGVAKMESTSLTRTGMVIGTPDYMSPEQITGQQVDARTDIFSTGIVFYEMLTRSKPFTAESITSVIYNVIHKQPPSFSELELDVPPDVEAVIRKAMAKDLGERYADIREMGADLRSWMSGGEVSAASAPAAADDATAELSSAELGSAATQAGQPGAGTVQVAESKSEREGARTVVEEGPDRRARKLPLVIGAVAVAVVLAVVGAKLLLPGPSPEAAGGVEGEGPAAVAPRAAVGVDVIVGPWARIDRLERVDGSGTTELALDEAITPVRLELPPGSYRMRVSNPELGLEDTIDFRVAEGADQQVRRQLPGFDPGAALQSVLVSGS